MSLRAKRGNLLPIPEIASAGFVSLAMTEWGVILSRSPEHSEGAAKNLTPLRTVSRDSSSSRCIGTSQNDIAKRPLLSFCQEKLVL